MYIWRPISKPIFEKMFSSCDLKFYCGAETVRYYFPEPVDGTYEGDEIVLFTPGRVDPEKGYREIHAKVLSIHPYIIQVTRLRPDPRDKQHFIRPQEAAAHSL